MTTVDTTPEERRSIFHYYQITEDEQHRLVAFLRVALVLVDPEYRVNVSQMATAVQLSRPTLYKQAERIVVLAILLLRGARIGRPMQRAATALDALMNEVRQIERVKG